MDHTITATTTNSVRPSIHVFAVNLLYVFVGWGVHVFEKNKLIVIKIE